MGGPQRITKLHVVYLPSTARLTATMAAGIIADTRNSARKTILGCRTITLSRPLEYEAVKILIIEQSHHTLVDKIPKWERIP